MLKVLLVDDEPVALKALKVIINWSELGYAVCGEARDGKSALQLIEQHQPDVVVTDIRMPAMDGLELIRQSREQLALKTKFIILSGYGDFQYAQQAIKYGVADYLLKPVDEDDLSEALRRLQQEMKQEHRQEQLRQENSQSALRSRIRSLIHSDRKPDEALSAGIREGLRLSEGSKLRYVEMKLVGQGDPVRAGGSAAEAGAIADYLEKNYPLFAVETEDSRLSLLFFYENEEAQDVSEFFSSLQKELAKVFGVQTAVIAGMPGGGLEGLPKSRDSVRKLETSHYFYEQSDLLLYEDFEDLDCDSGVGDFLKNDAVIKGVAECDFTAASAALDGIFESLKRRRVSIDSVKLFLNNVVIEIVKLLSDLQGDSSALIRTNAAFVNSLETMTLGEAHEKTLRLCFKAIHMVDSLKKQGSGGVVSEARSYLEQNYMRDINLKIVADKLHINPAYLGQQFLKKTGRHFNDYLNDIRIQSAKKYLATSSLKIYEIADKVGFKNTDYFTSKFQKIEKMSPTEYRAFIENRQ